MGRVERQDRRTSLCFIQVHNATWHQLLTLFAQDLHSLEAIQQDRSAWPHTVGDDRLQNTVRCDRARQRRHHFRALEPNRLIAQVQRGHRDLFNFPSHAHTLARRTTSFYRLLRLRTHNSCDFLCHYRCLLTYRLLRTAVQNSAEKLNYSNTLRT